MDEDFISTVSHELRTPLTSIRGFAQTMLSSWDKLDDESKKKFIKIIEEQSQRLINLVENMLAVTKLQSHNNLIVYKEIDIRPLINQTIMVVKAEYPSQNFEVKIQDNLPAIFADRDKFLQILTNLIENSAKYSPDGDTTVIKAVQHCNSVVITFTNRALPISEQDYDKIFTKFSRIDNPLTRKVQGSGLGLYITKNLTEKMGGKISVNSTNVKDDSGLADVTFTLEMPVRTLEEQARIKCSQ